MRNRDALTHAGRTELFPLLQDFQNLAALFAKRYAPANWKKQALGFDLFNLKPWLDKINAVKDDLYGPGSGVKWFNLEDPDGNQVFLVQA